MSPETLELLNRRLARTHKEHMWELSSAVQNALRIVNPSRKATISESLDAFRKGTAAAQAEYGAKLRAEVMLIIEQTNQQALDQAAKAAILRVTSTYLNDDLYTHRFQGFEEAFNRHVGGQGLSIDLALFRFDIAKSLYEVGSLNFVRSTHDKLADDLELIVQRVSSVALHAQPTGATKPAAESKLEQANRLVKLEPNLFGIGFNLNYLIRKLMGKNE